MIDVVVNGEPQRLKADLSLASWLESIDRDPRVVAIEHNGEIVPRSSFSAVRLENGDRLEVVQFVQGG